MVILNNDDSVEAGVGDEAKGASRDVDIGRIERDASLHQTFAIPELAPAPTKSINTFGPWNDVGEPAPGLGSRKQYDVPSASA